jgi:hypothetical protein
MKKAIEMSVIFVDVNKVAYEEMEKRLHREGQTIIHPRTKERIVSCSNCPTPKFYGRKHLNRCPRIAYHRRINQQQISGKFKLEGQSDKTLRSEGLHPTDTAILKILKEGKIAFRKTAQYKTVWFSATMRRR